MQDDAVADRYAGALFALARDQGAIAQVGEELERVLHMFGENPMLSRALNAPDVPQAVKKSIVKRILADRVSPLLLNFLFVLVDNQRIDAFPSVVRRFRVLVQEAAGELTADVEVAADLPPDVKKQIEDVVSKQTGRKAIVRWHKNPDILGGVIIKFKDKLIDYSLRKQLNQMKERLVRA
jgi:F-type H+-transporting ATPase subunit delta